MSNARHQVSIKHNHEINAANRGHTKWQFDNFPGNWEKTTLPDFANEAQRAAQSKPILIPALEIKVNLNCPSSLSFI